MAKTDGPFQKVRPDLPDDPKFIRMVALLRAEPDFAAHVLGLSVPQDPAGPLTHSLGAESRTCWNVSELVPPAVAAGVIMLGLVRVWGAVYAARTGEVLDGLTVPEIDDVGGVPGLGWAMSEVGWAEHEAGPAVRFPGLAGWFRSGEARSNAERAKDYRERRKGREGPSVTKPVTRRDERHAPSRDACARAVTFVTSASRQETREKIEEETQSGPSVAQTSGPADAAQAARPLTAAEFQAEWNAALPWARFAELPPNRGRLLRTRLFEPGWLDRARAGMAKAARSPFLRGESDRPFRLTIDWFLNDDHLTRILEGQYDERPVKAGPAAKAEDPDLAYRRAAAKARQEGRG